MGGGDARTVRGPRLVEIMARRVVTLSPEDSLREAVEVLREKQISGAPVTVGERVVGVLSATDVLEFERSAPEGSREGRGEPEWSDWGAGSPDWEEGDDLPARYFLEMWRDAETSVDERLRAGSAREGDVLDEHTVSEAMTRRVCFLAPDASIQEASAYMVRAGIHRVLVMEGERLLGLVSTTDILRAVAGDLIPPDRHAGT